MIAALLLLAQADAPSTLITFPFAPPVGTPVIEEQVRTESVAGAPTHFTVRRSYLFEREGDGWRATLTHLSAESDATGPTDTGFRAGSSPLIGVPIVARLEASGRVLAISNADEAWARFRTGQQALRRELEARGTLSDADRRVIAAIVDGLVNLPADAVAARLAGEFEPLLGLAGRSLAPGVPIALDGVDGTLVLRGATRDEARVELRSVTPPGSLAEVETTIDYRVSARSGLVLERRQRRTTRMPDFEGVSEEIRRILF